MTHWSARPPARRPRVASDRSFPGRWLVTYHGHVYPFPSWDRALSAASDADHLCRYMCICPVLYRTGVS